MITHKSAPIFVALLGAVALGISAQVAVAKEKTAAAPKENTAQAAPGKVLSYRLALAEDGATYQVLMKPSQTPKPDISLSGQVTLKVPHSNKFSVKGLTSHVTGANWVEASRVDAPKEDAAHDYISFSFVGLQGSSARNFAWKADSEQLVFSFQNEGGCVNGVSLMANDDPFNASPNSASTNPGNHFTNLGWGDVSQNNYAANTGDAIKCAK